MSALVGALCAWLYWITHPSTPATPLAATAVLGPVYAMVGLVAAVWFLMVAARNYSVLSGISSVRYYRDYVQDVPPAWTERPARAYENLLQLPQLFYVAAVLMLVLDRVDSVQLDLCWLFVALRALHAVVFLVWNRVAYRFCAYLCGSVTLGVLWVRLALG